MEPITQNADANEITFINYSHNPQITPEQTKDAAAKKTTGWILKQVEWKKETLEKMVQNEAYICSKLTDGHKTKENVEEVYFLALDFDNKDDRKPEESIKKKFEYITKDAFIKEALKWKFSWFLHTTVSHRKKNLPDGKPCDKFRVIIPFSQASSDSIIRNELKEFWLKKYPNLDTTCFQGERYYIMSPKAEVYFHNVIDEDGLPVFFNPYCDEVKNIKVPTATSRTKSKKIQIELFDLDLEVILADNETKMKIHEIVGKTPIFCPYCIHDSEHRGNPDSANAFIDINNAGYPYIYCSSEDKTYWPNPKDPHLTNVKLFWNTTVGAVSLTEYIPPDDKSEDSPNKTVYVFKNNDDFINYCNNERIDPSIKNHLIRAGLIFNPKLPGGLSGDVYNLFEETPFMKKDYSGFSKIQLSNVVSQLKTKTPVIHELLYNLLGDDEIIMRFINWNAFILQKRERTSTAWLIQSEEQGIGKDFTFNFILKPIFGNRQSQILNGSRIGKQFNSMDLHCFLRGYNEVFSNKDNGSNTYRKEWLKDSITGKEQTIEFKGVDSYQAKNHMNFILFSNNDQPIIIDHNDRRYNVVKNEKAKKVKCLSFYTREEDLPPLVQKELGEFADILFTTEFDQDLVNTVIETSAKEDLIKLSSDEYDKFIDALHNGDSDYFMLDEIFPPSESEKMFAGSNSGLVRSVNATELDRMITEYEVIPAAYMNRIIKFHFNQKNYREALERLKQKKLVVKQKRLGNLPNQKVYMMEDATL